MRQPSISKIPASLQAAFDECRNMALGHYENFPVGSVLLPKKLRPHFFSMYAFMRTADDFADMPHRTGSERLAMLTDWRDQLHSLFSGEVPTHPIFQALQFTIRQFDLALEPFDRLLDAFTFDATGDVRFSTEKDLYWYTARSANPVGRLVLALFAYEDAERIAQSDAICTALQLLNFIQDAREDLENGRCYFPLEDLYYGVTADNLNFKTLLTDSDRFKKIARIQANRVKTLLDKGASLPESVKGRLRFELRAVIFGARLLLQKIEHLGYDTITQRPTLNKSERIWVLIKSVF
ncbi:MAG: squalene synthase HpnC [Candidatus Kapaibacterium sp.]